MSGWAWERPNFGKISAKTRITHLRYPLIAHRQGGLIRIPHDITNERSVLARLHADDGRRRLRLAEAPISVMVLGMSRTWIPWAGGALALTALLGALLAPDALAASKLLARGRVEQPAYTVLDARADFEVRRYQPRLVAEVEVDGDPQRASNAGFRLLADFIFGGNTRAESVAMTAPVDRRPAGQSIAMTSPVDRRQAGERWVIAFTMPSKYTRDTLPRPDDPRVQIREVPAATYAVRRFSGAPGEPAVRAEMDTLRAAVLAAGLRPTGAAPVYARYDPPWTPGPLRRNEVLLEIADPAAP
jgi:hypothetical protein